MIEHFKSFLSIIFITPFVNYIFVNIFNWIYFRFQFSSFTYSGLNSVRYYVVKDYSRFSVLVLHWNDCFLCCTEILKFLSSHLSTVDHITEMNWATHWFQKPGIIFGQDGTKLCACASVQSQRKVLHREL